MVKYVSIDEELEIPKGIVCTINEQKLVSVKGKLGTMTKDFGHAKKIDIKIDGNKVFLHADFPRKNTVALTTTLKNILHNMFLGVAEGYEYRMKIVYSHFPITLEPPKKGSDVILIKNFLGERAPRITHSIGDVKIKADKEEVIVSGTDKELVGQTCANIQKRCRIKNKDKRVFQDGIYVYEKLLGNKQIWVIK
ncbi:50S ribosomal protein L6 [Promethearchaeum syntrophicum]|uniref:50S ribosomal protein L6 n=1 Tax=Promethearchaeum syntrophicum TaxID=2594042 RepID=A0A5B9D9E7_9ARCH|nr:50S ribosomal protein L6 [Candidatus Prometheoarchaeum syntrophicum]QEE15350.1 50S ribosomal protein L6 [Candidatus Prometheoarchaeum syntrophicum]